jgi:hypothetical protein
MHQSGEEEEDTMVVTTREVVMVGVATLEVDVARLLVLVMAKVLTRQIWLHQVKENNQ